LSWRAKIGFGNEIVRWRVEMSLILEMGKVVRVGILGSFIFRKLKL